MAVNATKKILRPFQAPEFAINQKGEHAFKRIGAERGVIGSLFVLPNKFPTVKAILGDNPFCELMCQQLWDAMLKLDRDGQPVDSLLILDTLEGLWGRTRDEWQTILQKFHFDYDYTRAENILHYAQSVRAAAVRRAFDEQLQETRRKNADGNLPDQMVPDLSARLFKVCEGFRAAPMERAGESILFELDQGIRDRQENPDAAKLSIPTGLPGLDAAFGGWQRGLVHVIGGIPNMGKTGVMLSCALNAAQRNIPVAYFGFADGNKQRTVARMIGMVCGVTSDLQLNGGMSAAQYLSYREGHDRLQALSMYVDDQLNTPQSIETQLRTLRETTGIGLVFIDYYQRMEHEEHFEGQYEKLVRISRDLVKMGKELEIPVIVGAQSPAHILERKDPRPLQYDVSDCKAIVQDADVVFYVHRPYKIDPMVSPTIAELCIRKLRIAGKDGIAETCFNPDTGLFSAGHKHDPHTDPDPPTMKSGDPHDIVF